MKNSSMTSVKRPAAFHDAVVADFHTKKLGGNGMPEYTDTGVNSDVLALSQMVRGGDPKSLVDLILARGSSNDFVDLVVLLFSTRNARGGKGEKQLAHKMFLRVWYKYPETSKRLLELFPHFGYWKDLLLLIALARKDVAFAHARELTEAAMNHMHTQFVTDLVALKAYKDALTTYNDNSEVQELRRKGPAVSLLAKWLPREGSSLDKKCDFVKQFTLKVWPELVSLLPEGSWEAGAKERGYRRVVAEITSYLDLPEVLLAAQREDEIKFGRVASKAAFALRKVFLNEDKNGHPRSKNPKRVRLAERFVEHVLNKGLNGAQLMPHEIVKKIMGKPSISRAEELVLDAQWKSIWKNVLDQVEAKAAEDGLDFNPTRMVPMADVSGSMYGVPIEVSIALSIGLSEITHEAFKDMVLTFSSTPTFHKFNPTDSIVQKVRSLERAPWGMSTNFEAAYDLILNVVTRHRLARKDMPALIVFSDMQFDVAAGRCGGSTATMHDAIRSKVKTIAQELTWEDSELTPIVYWNLRNVGGHPVDRDTEGAVLLSGFSPSLLKLVMSGEALRDQEVEVVQADGTVVSKKLRVTPGEVLRKMLDDKLYDPVRAILVASRE